MGGRNSSDPATILLVETARALKISILLCGRRGQVGDFDRRKVAGYDVDPFFNAKTQRMTRTSTRPNRIN